MSTDPLTETTTVSEVAKMFGVTPGGIRQAILEGRLYARRSGSTHLIRVADALRYYKRQPNHWPEGLEMWSKPE